MQIILARFLSIQASDILRISFESVPIVLAGMWLGPLSGAIVALIADILGTVLSGYGIWFPPIALGPVLVGVISGLSTKYVFHSDLSSTRESWKVVVTVLVAGIVNSFLVGTVTTTMYSIIVMGNTNAFSVLLWTNFLGRLTTKPGYDPGKRTSGCRGEPGCLSSGNPPHRPPGITHISNHPAAGPSPGGNFRERNQVIIHDVQRSTHLYPQHLLERQ